jgi:hypothetical protein
MTFLIFSFASTHAALHAQNLFNVAKVSFTVIPTPREITANCGIALRVEMAWADKSIAVISSMNDISGGYSIHKVVNEEGQLGIQPLSH